MVDQCLHSGRGRGEALVLRPVIRIQCLGIGLGGSGGRGSSKERGEVVGVDGSRVVGSHRQT